MSRPKKQGDYWDIPFEFTGAGEIEYVDLEEFDRKHGIKNDWDDDNDVNKGRARRWIESLYRRDSRGRFMPKTGLASVAAAQLPPAKNTWHAETLDRAFRHGYQTQENPWEALKTAEERLARIKEEGDTRGVPDARYFDLKNKKEAYRKLPYFDRMGEAGDAVMSPAERAEFDELIEKYGTFNVEGGQEAYIAGLKQAIAEIDARDTDEPRLARKLPKPKGEGDEAAGKAAAMAVGQARRRWLRNRAQSVLETMNPEHPQHDYWLGVIRGANQQSNLERRFWGVRGGEETGRQQGLQVERDAREKRLDDAKMRVQRLPEGHIERPYWEGVVRGLEEALNKPDNRRTFRAGEDLVRGADRLNVARLGGLAEKYLGEIQRRRDAGQPLENDESRELFWQGVLGRIGEEEPLRVAYDDGFEEALDIAEPLQRQAMIEEARHDMARGGARQIAKARGLLAGLGAPEKEVPRDDPNFQVGFNIFRDAGRNNKSFIVDTRTAIDELQAAQADGNDGGVAYWAGALQAMLGPPPPKPITGLPNPSDVQAPDDESRQVAVNRAASHRLPGDEFLESPVKRVQPLGGGINTSLKGVLENGEVVVIKPVEGAHNGRMYSGIAPGTDTIRERAGFLTARALGVHGAPHNITRDVQLPDRYSAYSGLAVVQTFTPGRAVHSDDMGWNRNRADMRKIALLDMVIGNMDRHAGNALVTPDGRITPIDHGLSFSIKPDDPGNPGPVNQLTAEERELTNEERDVLAVIAGDDFAQTLLDVGLPARSVILMRKRVSFMLRENRIPKWREINTYLREA